MYLFLGLSGTGKTTAADLVKKILKESDIEGTIIHPYQEGKCFIEQIYNIPYGSLDTPEYKERLVPDLEGKPMVWEDGHCPTYQDLMVKEFFFREAVDPYFSSRCLKRNLNNCNVGVCCGIEEPLVHGVRKKEEIDVTLTWAKEQLLQVNVVYLKRQTNKQKGSDSYLEDNLAYLESQNANIYSIVNDFSLSVLEQSLRKVVGLKTE